MRIGINLLAFLPGVSGGIEFYVRNLILALARIDAANEYYLFANRDNCDVYSVDQRNFHQVRIDVGARPQVKRILWEQLRLPPILRQLRLDVFHSPSYTFPVFATVPGVLTICDMLYRVYPESIGQPKLAFWRIFVPWSARYCRKVLTISEYSKRDIIRFLRLPVDKIVVTPLALDQVLAQTETLDDKQTIETLTRYGIRSPFILGVGGLGLHKNAVTLIRALAEIRERPAASDLTMVITVNDYGARAEVETAAQALGLTDAVVLPGYVSRNDLPVLYREAVAYASASYFEGFGLTLLEAMAYGTPVVTSDRCSLPEVAGDAAIVVAPDDVSGFADGFYRLLTNASCKVEMSERGRRRVQDFSWDRTAELTLQAYNDAII
jgi:glycosyltransferase involved in cell wall biosynthesis